MENRPPQVLADRGLFSGHTLDRLEAFGIDGYVPDSNLAREINLGKAVQEDRRSQREATQRMRHKLRTRRVSGRICNVRRA